jgi:threonine/homoserine/homoserine lactone efflux protein
MFFLFKQALGLFYIFYLGSQTFYTWRALFKRDDTILIPSEQALFLSCLRLELLRLL